jgi:hypothetical protein
MPDLPKARRGHGERQGRPKPLTASRSADSDRGVHRRRPLFTRSACHSVAPSGALPAPVSPPGRRRPSRLPARLTAIAEPIGGAPLFSRSACHSVARPSRPLRCVAPSDSGTPRQALHAGAVDPFRGGVRYSLTGRTCGLHDSRGTVPSPPGSSYGAPAPRSASRCADGGSEPYRRRPPLFQTQPIRRPPARGLDRKCLNCRGGALCRGGCSMDLAPHNPSAASADPRRPPFSDSALQIYAPGRARATHGQEVSGSQTGAARQLRRSRGRSLGSLSRHRPIRQGRCLLFRLKAPCRVPRLPFVWSGSGRVLPGTAPFLSGHTRQAGIGMLPDALAAHRRRCAVSDSASETLRRHFYTCDSASEEFNHLLAPRQQSTTRARMG